jgi:hypothetical protein
VRVVDVRGEAVAAAERAQVPSPLDLVELRAMGGALERAPHPHRPRRAPLFPAPNWTGLGAAELRGRQTARGTLVARRPSAAAVQQAVDPDGIFARTPLP